MARHRRRGRRLGPIERDVLNELTGGDILYSFLLSARSTRMFYKLARERANYRYRRKLAIERLTELDFIEKHGERLSITLKGRNAIGEAVQKTYDMLHSSVWDRKWRIVAFDIPEEYSILRAKVRTVLKRAGFEKLQQSVWIFPHECRDLTDLIKQESGLSQYILYGVLEHIENEGRLKKLFKL